MDAVATRVFVYGLLLVIAYLVLTQVIPALLASTGNSLLTALGG